MTVETVVLYADQRGLGLTEAYARRELLYFLIWRDIKIRYKQTMLGIAWAMLVPAIRLVIFSVIFGWLTGIKPDGDYPYTLFVFTGLAPWTFFAIRHAGRAWRINSRCSRRFTSRACLFQRVRWEAES